MVIDMCPSKVTSTSPVLVSRLDMWVMTDISTSVPNDAFPLLQLSHFVQPPLSSHTRTQQLPTPSVLSFTSVLKRFQDYYLLHGCKLRRKLVIYYTASSQRRSFRHDLIIQHSTLSSWVSNLPKPGPSVRYHVLISYVHRNLDPTR